MAGGFPAGGQDGEVEAIERDPIWIKGKEFEVKAGELNNEDQWRINIRNSQKLPRSVTCLHRS